MIKIKYDVVNIEEDNGDFAGKLSVHCPIGWISKDGLNNGLASLMV